MRHRALDASIRCLLCPPTRRVRNACKAFRALLSGCLTCSRPVSSTPKQPIPYSPINIFIRQQQYAQFSKVPFSRCEIGIFGSPNRHFRIAKRPLLKDSVTMPLFFLGLLRTQLMLKNMLILIIVDLFSYFCTVYMWAFPQPIE